MLTALVATTNFVFAQNDETRQQENNNRQQENNNREQQENSKRHENLGEPGKTNLYIRERMTVGLKIGANFSNVYNSQGQNFQADSKIGLALGGFVTIPLMQYIGIQPELIFSQKGFHATGSILGSKYDFTRTTNYLDIPIFFAFKPSPFLTLLVGPQYSYLLNQKDVFTNATTSIEQEKVFENDNIRRNMLCFVMGFDVNVNHLSLGARVGWDVQNNNGNGTSSTPRYKNEWVQFTLGYRFYY